MFTKSERVFFVKMSLGLIIEYPLLKNLKLYNKPDWFIATKQVYRFVFQYITYLLTEEVVSDLLLR